MDQSREEKNSLLSNESNNSYSIRKKAVLIRKLEGFFGKRHI